MSAPFQAQGELKLRPPKERLWEHLAFVETLRGGLGVTKRREAHHCHNVR